MYEFTTISGRVIEAKRYMNRWPRLNEPDPAQERWEVWISEQSSSEVKLTVASRVMPARCGHSVTFVVADDRPVGMINKTIGASVNFTQSATDHFMHTGRAVPDQARHLCGPPAEGRECCTVAESWRR